MVQLTIHLDKSQFQHFDDSTVKNIEDKGLKYVGQDLLRNLQINSPVDTGHLRKWFFKSRGSSMIDIRSPAIYGVFVNDGTGVYGPNGQVIRPKNGKYLVFKPGPKWKGRVTQSGKWKGYVALRYSKGQKGQKFVEKSMEQTEQKLESLFISAVRDVLS